MSEYKGTILGKLQIPLHVFQEGNFRFSDVIIDYLVDPDQLRWDKERKEWLYNPDNDFRIPTDIRAYIKPLVERRRKEAEARGAPFFDGQMVRLVDYGIKVEDKDAETEKERLILRLAPTSWFTYSATNRSLDDKILEGQNGNPISIKDKYGLDVLNLNDCLANSIGVSATVISEPDHKLVMVERSEKLSQYPSLYGVAAAGFMDRTRDIVAGVPNPFKTIQRELEEEAGIKCSVNDYKLFTVGRALDDLHVELFGEIRTKYTVQEIMSAPKRTKYESLRIFDVPLTPKDVLKYLVITVEKVPAGVTSGADTWVAGRSPKWVPAHAYNTIQSLMREYGQEKVMRDLSELGFA